MKEDFDVDGELGFEPAVPAAPESRPTTRRRSRARRRLLNGFVMLMALTLTGGAYSFFASASNANSAAAADSQIEAGRKLYESSCITCHGINLQGVQDRGVSLVGVGAAAAYFQVSTGRMPAARQGGDISRKEPKFTEEQTLAIAAYIESIGGGPSLPKADAEGKMDLADANVAEGGELFRLNCASCHGTGAQGAPLSAGKIAPSMFHSTDAQIYTAMQTGPENMPVFNDNQLTPEEKTAIVHYVQTLKHSMNPGGHGIGRLGPVAEGLVIWIIGMGFLMGMIFWIGAKS